MEHALLRELAFNGLPPSIIEEVSDTISYVGYCSAGTTDEDTEKWCIKKIVSTGSPAITTQKWADGSQNFDKKWSLRDTYTYTYPK